MQIRKGGDKMSGGKGERVTSTTLTQQQTINREPAIEMLRHALPLKPMPDALIVLLRLPEAVKIGDTPYITLHGEKADEKSGMVNDPFYALSRGEIPAWLEADPFYVNIRSTGQQTYFTFIDKRKGRNIAISVLVASELEGAMEKPPTWKNAIDAISNAEKTLQLDKQTLTYASRSLIDSIEKNLADNAKVLRAAVKSYISTITSTRASSIPNTSLLFRNPSNNEVLARFSIGEEEAGDANLKIESVIVACINAAKADLAFLRKKAAELEGDIDVAKDMQPLAVILQGNGYWRFFEIQ